MLTISRCIAVLVVLLSLAAPAGAGSTYTPPVRSSQGDNLGCTVLNLTDSPVEVMSELNNGQGTIVDSQTSTVPAGQSRLLARSNTAVFGAYCRFVFDGDAAQVRGSISLEDAGGSNTRLLLPATPLGRDSGGLSTTTFTPPVRSSEGDNLGCTVLNLNDVPVQVVSELNNGQGTVVDSQTTTVSAGRSLLLARSNTAVFGAYCRFQFAGNPATVRGSISLEDAGGSNTRLLYEATTALAAPPVTETATATPSAPPDATPTPTTGSTPAAGCCGDCNGDGTVAINELIIAVNNALSGCPATP